MKLDDDIVEVLAGGTIPDIDPVGTSYAKALIQADQILYEHDTSYESMRAAVIVLITKIQQQQKSIEMFEYTQKWRKRRP